MIRLLLTASIHVRVFLRAWMPSNIVLDVIRRRQNLKWGIPAMLLAVPYLAVAYWCRAVIEGGAPGWLHVIVLLCLWSALKFIIMGPVSLVLLAAARFHERGRQDVAVGGWGQEASRRAGPRLASLPLVHFVDGISMSSRSRTSFRSTRMRRPTR